MNWRIILAVGIAAFMALPSAAMASHMGQYVLYPTSHDSQGAVLEPDGLSTSVLGPTVTNCVVELPPFGAVGKCGGDAVKTGLGDVIAPGCTGKDANGNAVRRDTGACGLWTVGLRPNSVAIIPPGTVPAPLSEQGMGAGNWPGRYMGTVRFMDGVIDNDATQNPGTGGPTNLIGVDNYLREEGVGNWVLPGDSMLWAWNGDWTDLNGNGVVDACFATCSAAQVNEFVWRGNCQRFLGEFSYFSIANGFCKEDPNPNVEGSHTCDGVELGPCASANMVFWIFPGNHQAGMVSDNPGNQVLTWTNNFNCNGPPTCDEVDRDSFGDPLLGKQDEVTPDGLGMDDRTGDNGAADVGDDTARHFAGNLGNVGTYYGDDGFLVTAVYVYGYNCANSATSPNRFDLTKAAGTAGGCTFLDVDQYPTANPAAEALLVGDPENPNRGLKSEARGAWLLFQSIADGAVPVDTVSRRIDQVTASQDVYLASQGPLQGALDDTLLNAGFSREPNSPAQTVVTTSGSISISDSYVGTSYGSCAALPSTDARNANALVAKEAQHRGFCNVGTSGLGSAYDAYGGAIGRGWLDAQPLRHVFVGTPVTVTPPCTYCFYGTPFVGINVFPEPTEVGVNAAEDHGRTLGPGNYIFTGTRGTWKDAPYSNDESVFPAAPNSVFVTYPQDNWVGVIEKSGGQWHYRNFLPISCTTDKDAVGGASVHEAAECNPYLDGNAQDPQDYTSINQGGEFDGTDALLCGGSPMFLAPADGNMDTQIVVIQNYGNGFGPLLPNVGQGIPNIVTYGPGPVDPLASNVVCGGGGFQTGFELVWPSGNRGDDMVTWITHSIPLGVDLDGDGVQDSDVITDVDVYDAIAV